MKDKDFKDLLLSIKQLRDLLICPYCGRKMPNNKWRIGDFCKWCSLQRYLL